MHPSCTPLAIAAKLSEEKCLKSCCSRVVGVHPGVTGNAALTLGTSSKAAFGTIVGIFVSVGQITRVMLQDYGKLRNLNLFFKTMHSVELQNLLWTITLQFTMAGFWK
ncbi:hypothetical protein CMV_016284 [Castanea mollissima]|uniref:Uncharacterized protein n=1 Tax=Castanea mollissima TaxID=60419 RepID=A0A8J4VRU9_9ROSI|nr:hypothetical protein CMV_016284 [Castanea mollissima]